MEAVRTVGIPGAGKTTRGIAYVEMICGRGIPLLSIGYSSYTRTARREAAQRASERFAVPLEELERLGWFRTIHSSVMRLVGVRKGELVNGDREWFRDLFGGSVSAEDIEEEDWHEQFKGDDRSAVAFALKLWDLSRNRLQPVQELYDELAGAMRPSRAMLSDWHTAIHDYERAKERDGRSDFTDFVLRYAGVRATLDGLESVDPQGDVPDLFAWILDECQDTSALMNRAAVRLTQNVRWLYLMLDPLQEIYRWAGADADYAMTWPVKAEVNLTKSWRCSEAVLSMAVEYISRNSRYLRGIQNVEPACPGGSITTQHDEDLASIIDPQTDTLVMTRTNQRAFRLGEMLTAAGIPWKSNRSGARFPKITANKLTTALDDLQNDRPISGDLWGRVVDAVPKELLARGTKTRFKAKEEKLKYPVIYLVDTPGALLGGTRELYDKIISGQWKELVGPEASSALEAKKKWGDAAENPRVVVSTIHGTKGMEASRVYLDTAISKPVLDALRTEEGAEQERRVWYTGITRSKSYLCLLRPSWGPAYNELLDLVS